MIFLVLVIEINQGVAVHAIRRQQNQNDKIGIRTPYRRRWPGIGLESRIEEVLADVVADPLGLARAAVNAVTMRSEVNRGVRTNFYFTESGGIHRRSTSNQPRPASRLIMSAF